MAQRKTWRLSWLVCGAAGSICCPTFAQTPSAGSELSHDESTQEAGVQEVIVTGTRRADRSAKDSTAPIDVFTAEELQRQPATDTNDVLRNLVPSFAVQRISSADGSTFVRPPNLRGLPPDQTLVLVNNKRFHRSALVQLSGGPLAAGAQAPDLAQIPTLALKQVEVLRDGASALYGSDAIAGVMNFLLKDARDGGSLVTQVGTTYDGDGTSIHIQGNSGFALGHAGFLNISGEYVHNDATERGVQIASAAALEALGVSVEHPAQHWGSPPLEAERMFFNSGVPLDNGVALYLFGNLGHSSTQEGFYYRDPTDPTHWITTQFTLTDGAPFAWKDVFPGGFAPRFEGDIRDGSITGGIKQELGSGLTYDFSASYGASRLSYDISNTINPSLGPSSPRAFRVGALRQRETNFNADFTYPIPHLGVDDSATFLAFGGEWRRESYTITPGEPLSYEAGPYASDGLPIGSSGYPGFSADSAGTFSRNSYAIYGGAETRITTALRLGVALRQERFDVFGSTTNWKAEARYQINDRLALRGSVNTGFRAPTPGQAQTSSLQTDLLNGKLVALATFPPDSVVARFFGARPLTPETSFNFAGGLVFALSGQSSVTIDYYNIKVEDRIGQTSAIEVSDAERAELQALGVPGANTLGTVNFLANAFDTRTQGIDLVASGRVSLGRGAMQLTAAANFNRTAVLRFDPNVIDPNRKLDLEHGLPSRRLNLSVDYRLQKFSFLGRGNYYSRWEDNSFLGEHYGSAWVFDAEVGFQFNKAADITVGAANLFNRYPDKTATGRAYGMLYPDTSPFGYDGGTYYARLNYRF